MYSCQRPEGAGSQGSATAPPGVCALSRVLNPPALGLWASADTTRSPNQTAGRPRPPPARSEPRVPGWDRRHVGEGPLGGTFLFSAATLSSQCLCWFHRSQSSLQLCILRANLLLHRQHPPPVRGPPGSPGRGLPGPPRRPTGLPCAGPQTPALPSPGVGNRAGEGERSPITFSPIPPTH